MLGTSQESSLMTKKLINTDNQTPANRFEHNQNYRIDIQEFRAVAVIAVVLYHAVRFVPGGFYGVDVFFTISGYVICQLVIREIRTDIDHRFRLREFFFRRFKRLTPPLSLTIIISLILSIFLISPIGPLLTSAETGLAAQVFSSNVFIAVESGDYFAVGASQNVFLHTWSLAVEEQFYIGFAICIFLYLLIFRPVPSRIKSFKVLTLTITSLAILVSFSYGILIAYNLRIRIMPPSLFGWYLPEFNFYNPFSRTWQILVGCMAGYITYSKDYLPKTLKRIFRVLGVLLVFTAFAGQLPISTMPNQYTLVPVIGTLLLLMSPFENRGKRKISIFSKLLVFIGDRSYGLYLIHWPVLVFGSYIGSGTFLNLVLALFSLVLADQLHKRIEVPLKNKTYDSGIKQFKFMSKTLVPVFLIIGIVVFIDGKNLFSNSIKNLRSAVQREHITQRNNCSNTNPIYFGSSEHCDFNGPTKERGIIYLIGDSNADHFSEAVIGAAENLSLTVNTSIKAGCGFIFSVNVDCKDFVHETFNFLNNAKVGTLIVSLSESAWESELPEEQSSGIFVFTNELNQLSKKGFHILLVKPVPKFDRVEENSNIQNCSTLQIVFRNCPRAVHANLSEIDVHRRFALREISTLSLSNGIEVIDLDHFFCKKSDCVNTINGVPLFRDNSHITVDTSEKMIWEFTRYLEHGL